MISESYVESEFIIRSLLYWFFLAVYPHILFIYMAQ